jgi:hypothetical protein
MYPLLADLVAILHGLFILFAVTGGFLLLRRRWWVWLHAPAFLWAGFIEMTGWICPLTLLENRLRCLAGSDLYKDDWIDHYLMPLIYPESLTREFQICLGALIVFLNVILYGLFWHRSRRTLTTG